MIHNNCQLSKQLHQLFSQEFKTWLEGLVKFYNKNDIGPNQLRIICNEWSFKEQQLILDYFSKPKVVALVNSIFFFKIHPNELFAGVNHPEKIISIKIRLERVHYYIELLRQKLYEVALQNGLTPGMDYFLHDNALPPGLKIDVDEEFKRIIQEFIKELKFRPNQILLEPVDYFRDLQQAYKFCFKPNCLIDAAMRLQQNLLAGVQEQEQNLSMFEEKLLHLYAQFTTTECVNLYGYFANKDTQSLLSILLNVEAECIDEIPLMDNEDKNTINEVFNVLSCVIETLRKELANRHLLAEPYSYVLNKSGLKFEHCNLVAVDRVVRIYKRSKIHTAEGIEQLFQSIEEG